MKKTGLIILCVALACCLVACGGGSADYKSFLDVQTGKRVSLGDSPDAVAKVLGEPAYDEEIDEYTYRDGSVYVEYGDNKAVYFYVEDDGGSYEIPGYKKGMTEEEAEQAFPGVFDFRDFNGEIQYSVDYDKDGNKVSADSDNIAYSTALRYVEGEYVGFDLLDQTYEDEEYVDDEEYIDDEEDLEWEEEPVDGDFEIVLEEETLEDGAGV